MYYLSSYVLVLIACNIMDIMIGIQIFVLFYCRSSASVREVICNHKNRMMLIESRQKDYDFLMNECKQLTVDKHYATDKVHRLHNLPVVCICDVQITYVHSSQPFEDDLKFCIKIIVLNNCVNRFKSVIVLCNILLM